MEQTYEDFILMANKIAKLHPREVSISPQISSTDLSNNLIPEIQSQTHLEHSNQLESPQINLTTIPVEPLESINFNNQESNQIPLETFVS